MSGEENKDESALVPRPDVSIANPQVKPTRVLREMVAVSLARSEGGPIAPADLDTLVREAKELYPGGEGMTNANVRAFTLFYRAACQGHSEAQFYLGQMYELGSGVAEDPVEGMKWTRAAAEAGIGPAQWMLGVCYMSGDGMPKDEAEGVKWFRKAAEQEITEDSGNEWKVAKKEAQYSLALCFENGLGVPQNDREAVKWLQEAAGLRHAEALYHLGCRYCDGRGVSRDLVRGYSWLQWAADFGDVELAKDRIATLKAQLSPSEFDSISSIYRQAQVENSRER